MWQWVNVKCHNVWQYVSVKCHNMRQECHLAPLVLTSCNTYSAPCPRARLNIQTNEHSLYSLVFVFVFCSNSLSWLEFVHIFICTCIPSNSTHHCSNKKQLLHFINTMYGDFLKPQFSIYLEESNLSRYTSWNLTISKLIWKIHLITFSIAILELPLLTRCLSHHRFLADPKWGLWACPPPTPH